MIIQRSLPARPEIDEVEAAKILILNVEREDQARLEGIARQTKNNDVPDELFKVLLEMRRSLVYFQSKEQKWEAIKLLDLENVHSLFDDLIHRASKCLPSSSRSASSSDSNYRSNSLRDSSVSSSFTNSAVATTSSSGLYYEKETLKASELFSKDDSYLKKAKASIYSDGFQPGDVPKPQILDSTLKAAAASSQDGEKLSLIKLASLIEVSAKKGTRDLLLKNKLMDQIEWLPDSIGKLSSLITLDFSENQISALPATIGGLSSVTTLDLHSNRIRELPDCIGDLLSLVYLDVGANQLTSLTSTVGRLMHLQELDLSSNMLSMLPESIGSLVSLRKLNVETNNIDEFPHTIGQCSSLRELHADYNRLKALPEAVGRISSLEILSIRYNNISQFPTTMASLSSLRELDVSFNHLEFVPESLCFATTLVKMNISNNFVDLQAIPRSIGNLEMLEELNMSNNQIRVLPDSFRMLSRLRVLNVGGNPLEVPQKDVLEMGAQAVVQYMAELVEKRDVKSQPVKQKKSWTQICFFSRSNKRMRTSMNYVKA